MHTLCIASTPHGLVSSASFSASISTHVCMHVTCPVLLLRRGDLLVGRTTSNSWGWQITRYFHLHHLYFPARIRASPSRMQGYALLSQVILGAPAAIRPLRGGTRAAERGRALGIGNERCAVVQSRRNLWMCLTRGLRRIAYQSWLRRMASLTPIVTLVRDGSRSISHSSFSSLRLRGFSNFAGLVVIITVITAAIAVLVFGRSMPASRF